MTSCLQCLRAKRLVFHPHYGEDCEACVIRRLAYMNCDEREKYYDLLQRREGIGARAEAVRLVNLERARIKALSQDTPKARCT